jgi:hypothetical protein
MTLFSKPRRTLGAQGELSETKVLSGAFEKGALHAFHPRRGILGGYVDSNRNC